MTGFTNGEEEEVQLTTVVPFLVEHELMRFGAIVSKVKNWAVHTVTDGQLIMGENPASASLGRIENQYTRSFGAIEDTSFDSGCK